MLRRQIEWVAQGKYPILMGPSPRTAGQLLKRGVKFEFLPEFKDIGGLTGSSSATVMKINKSPHPNAAAVFINWLLTIEGQTLWSRANDQLSLRVDVPRDHVPAYLTPGYHGQVLEVLYGRGSNSHHGGRENSQGAVCAVEVGSDFPESTPHAG